MALELQKTDLRPTAPHLRAVGPDEVVPLPPPVAPAPEPSEINLRLFTGIGRYLLEQHGEETYRRVLKACGFEENALKEFSWGSVRQLGMLMSEVRSLAGSDEDFQDACAYELKEGYGPLRFMLMAATPKMLYSAVVKNFPTVSRVSTFEAEFPERGRTIIRYIFDPEVKHWDTRLLCLSRQAHLKSLPVMWGLPPAHITERGCCCHGDDYCTYELRYYEPSSIWLPVLGALLGLAAVGLASIAGFVATWAVAVFPLMGAMVAQLYQLHRGNQINLETGEEINRTLLDLMDHHTAAREEVLELNARQREWTRTLERQVGERTERLVTMVDRLRALDQARESNIRGVSHDLRNPLSLLKIEGEVLKDHLDMNDPECRDLLEGHVYAVSQMQELVNLMMHEATEQLHQRQHSPEALEVGPMVDVIRRRLRALAHGTELKTSVFSTREMPPRIWCHPIVFDRVVDNLLTNAVKYTVRGSIVVELDGTDGFLSIKVSDTGSGIHPERLRGIFQPRGNGQERTDESYGVGLSVVVHLLDELGGRLEVMSRPDIGTTFWAQFPTHVAETPERLRTGSAVDRVVTIRRIEED